MLTSYVPISIMVIIAFLLAIVMLIFARYFGKQKPGYAKESRYECGIDSDKPAIERFNVHYYVIAILFIAFKIGLLFLFPWAVAYNKLGLYGFVQMLIFVAILLIAYTFAIKNGVFEWGSSKGKKVVRHDDPWDEFDIQIKSEGSDG